jgi:D-alanyl-lipoteichoic acid acyltransferase DltB (MBOAT superfamily)
MEITSFIFILLSALSIFAYYLLKQQYRVLYLTLLSCGFIATYSPTLLLYVLAYTLINYLIGILLPGAKRKKSLFIFAIVLNLTQLILLKYVSFTIGPLLKLLHISWDATVFSRIIIPIGVSYFILQGIGYLMNVNLGWEKPERNFLHFLLYNVFFPRFISGPIDRSNRFLPQLKEKQSFSRENLTEAFRLVLFGLVKKVVIANQLSPIVMGSFDTTGSTESYHLLIAMLAQPLYLYFDFSGYTDIAIGIAKGFGITIPMNFNRPFLAENMTNFWKRFHASLSSWFNDYIFMRTMFRYRKLKQTATTIALFVTWILFGIWHGAGWNFMFLGVLQALAVYWEFRTKRWRYNAFSKLPATLAKWIGRLFTYFFYSFSLTFFFAPDLRSAFRFFTRIPESGGALAANMSDPKFLLVLVFILLVMILEIIKEDFDKQSKRFELAWNGQRWISVGFRWIVYYSMIVLIMMYNTQDLEFVYVQF